jgi:hypothetical protein
MAALVLAGAVTWLVLPQVQEWRADALLSEANGHMEKANEAMARIDIDMLDLQSLTSLEAIEAAGGAVVAAGPLLEESAAETALAMNAVSRGEGFPRLPGWYSQYLGKKRETAEARERQVQILQQASDRLSLLYPEAPLIFRSMQEMDRLLGQFQAAMASTQSDPGGSSASLAQIAASMRDIQHQLESRYSESGFNLLERMADNVKDNAEMVEQTKALADAVATGDQAQVQQASDAMQKLLMETDVGIDYLELWFNIELKPLKHDYDELQSRQHQLDEEAAEIFHQHR